MPPIGRVEAEMASTSAATGSRIMSNGGDLVEGDGSVHNNSTLFAASVVGRELTTRNVKRQGQKLGAGELSSKRRRPTWSTMIEHVKVRCLDSRSTAKISHARIFVCSPT